MSKKIATYKQCENCGYNPGRSTVPGPDEGNKTCWKCGHRVYRDYGVDQNQPTMSEMKHTPGPWSSSPQQGTPGHCFAAQVWGPDGKSLAVIEPTEDEREASANARIQAAAPEMVELLEDLIDHVWLPNTTHDRIETLLSKIKNDNDATD